MSADLIEEALECSRYGEIEELKDALSKLSLSINKIKNEFGNTLLHYAAGNGNIEIMELIITALSPQELSLYINEPNNEGNTALHWAALAGKKDAVLLLYKYGSDGKIRNGVGHTPLYYAEMFNHEEVAQTILENTIYEDDDLSEDAEDCPPETQVIMEEEEEFIDR